MEKFAVIEIQGKQYKVFQGSQLLVDRIKGEKPQAEVLLYADGDKIEIGKPDLKNVKVDIEIVEEVKGDKIRVVKYKAKSRYRKKIGYRQGRI